MYRCVECSFHAGSVKLKEFFFYLEQFIVYRKVSQYM